MTVITSLPREKRGKIVDAYEKAQTAFDQAHGAMLTACRDGIRGEAANALLLELDRAASFIEGHRKNVGRLLDDLTEDL